jgi:predicted nucleic acid-binding protein
MKRYVLDTNLYIRADRDAKWAEGMVEFVSSYLPFIYLHAVVAQEVIAGALDSRREKLIQDDLIGPFEKRGRIITPTFRAWKKAGLALVHMVQKRLITPGGFGRSFVNDCVMATSCREEGMVLITSNATDFELIRKVVDVEVSAPWPGSKS